MPPAVAVATAVPRCAAPPDEGSVALRNPSARLFGFPVAGGLLAAGELDRRRWTGSYGMWSSRCLMMLSRARLLSLESAMNQGAHAVSVAASMRRGLGSSRTSGCRT